MRQYKPSKDLKYLNRRIEELKRNFISSHMATSMGINFTNLENDLVRGFRLLCHAEIENYIENIVEAILSNAERKWDRSKTANYNLSCLLVFAEKNNSIKDGNQLIYKIISDFRKVIKRNNGIKDSDIKKLFTPLGIPENEFDAAWISSLSSYGSDRGVTAHTSKRTQTAFDINTEINNINFILSGMEDFERTVFAYI